MLTKSNYKSNLDTEATLYASFFSAEECQGILSELLVTTSPPYLPACFGAEQLPWTDLLLSIKQFVEDRLEIDLNSAWLYSNRSKKKFSLFQDLPNNQTSTDPPIALLYFGSEQETLQNGSLLLMDEGLNQGSLQRLYKPRKSNGPEFLLLFWKSAIH